MTISIDYGNTNIIDIEQSDLTLVSGTLYELDTDAFRLTLKDLEDDEIGIAFPSTHSHNTEVTVAGVTFARVIEILTPYSVRFEDTGSAYSVRLVGSNNNLFDVDSGILVPTDQVTVISGNSAGLQTVASGSGLSTEQATQLVEIYTRLGLNIADPITDTTNGIDSDSGDIEIVRTGDGETTSTLTRQ